MRQPIVFVTDYGRDDAYAAALVGGAMRVDPEAHCIDGTHGVPAGDVLAGAYHLKSLALAFDRNVVLCGVVDPGVGTDRRAIAIQLGDLCCVAPDNGLISYLWEEGQGEARAAVQLDIPVDASPTFHGRDVFAPAAAELASGTNLDGCGIEIDDPLVLDDAFAQESMGGLNGRVLLLDHFGNAVTTIRDIDIAGRAVRSVTWSGGGTDRVVTTYDEIGDGIAVLIGSAGHLEVSARRQQARAAGGPMLHDAVTVELG